MPIYMFLKVDGIAGESNYAKHVGETDVLSFSWGISQTVASDPTGGIVASQPRINQFSIVKLLDTTSPVLFQKCCTGEHIPEATFSISKAGETSFDFYKIRFTDVIITAVQPGGSAGGDAAMEQVSFGFDSAEICAKSQRKDGSPGGSVIATTCKGA